jgi:hypothetical protein
MWKRICQNKDTMYSCIITLCIEHIGYWLLYEWYRTKRPMHCGHFLVYYAPHLSSNHSWFVHQSSQLWLNQRHLIAKRGETGQEIATEFCLLISLSYLKGSFTCHKILQHGPTALLPIWRKSCYCSLSLVKIHCTWLGLYPWTLGLMASTVTITLPRKTQYWASNGAVILVFWTDKCYTFWKYISSSSAPSD